MTELKQTGIIPSGGWSGLVTVFESNKVYRKQIESDSENKATPYLLFSTVAGETLLWLCDEFGRTYGMAVDGCRTGEAGIDTYRTVMERVTNDNLPGVDIFPRKGAWISEVFADREWCSNQLVFGSWDEARDYGSELLSRWFVPIDHRPRYVGDTPITHTFDWEKGATRIETPCESV